MVDSLGGIGGVGSIGIVAAMKASEAGKLKVAELQKLLKERGLPSSGTKAELVQVMILSFALFLFS